MENASLQAAILGSRPLIPFSGGENGSVSVVTLRSRVRLFDVPTATDAAIDTRRQRNRRTNLLCKFLPVGLVVARAACCT